MLVNMAFFNILFFNILFFDILKRALFIKGYGGQGIYRRITGECRDWRV